MCEQTYERSPSYFRKFSKKFHYITCEKYPNLPIDNFALAFHNTQSDSCSIENVKHWHLLIFSDTRVNNSYTVPCPYACFTQLILGGINVQHTGDIFDKLKAAVDYNEKYSNDESNVLALRKRLPKIPVNVKKNQAMQTTLITSASLDRYLQVLNGPYGGHMSQIIDAFISGYGSIDMQNHSMVTHFELRCSDAQCYCYECTEMNYCD